MGRALRPTRRRGGRISGLRGAYRGCRRGISLRDDHGERLERGRKLGEATEEDQLGASTHGDDDLAEGMTLTDVSEGIADIVESERAVDVDADVPR